MPKPIKQRSLKIGLPAGSLVHVGDRLTDRTRVTIIDYDEAGVQERREQNVGDCLSFKDKPTVTWIDVDSLHEVELLEQLGSSFGVHPLALEDILNTDQRPKMEDYGSYIYLVLKMLRYDDQHDEIIAEQVSLILGDTFLISFQEIPGDVFDPTRDRIKSGKGRIRKEGADYLAYTLLDAIVDNYFIILEKLGERIQDLEDIVADAPTPATLRQIHKLKREMIFLRRAVWPLREVINGLQRCESPLMKPATLVYLKDIYDHTIHTIDTIEAYRDMLSGMLDIYLSTNSNRLNQIMKVLTIIATIFIPLTFIAGVYGMNFDNMPELKWQSGYFIVVGGMILIGLIMLAMFRRKKWL